MGYLLDANVFIQAKNLHYGFDFCPGFWDWLVKGNADGKVFSIEKVANELATGGDDLTAWAATKGRRLFLKPDSTVVAAMSKVGAWVASRGYTPAALSTFLQGADYYLVAHALAYKHTVVTHEVVSASVNKVKIPDVCIGMSVGCQTPYEMLRKERARFVLE